MFRETLQQKWIDKALDELNASAGFWRSYSSAALANYQNPLWTNRVGHVDWKKNYSWALYDITVNGGKIDVPSMEPSSGGTILEAEDASHEFSILKNEIKGFTGNGYLETSVGDAKHRVDWSYMAPETGSYTLEFRYTLKREQVFPSSVDVNGGNAGNINFWMTGKPGCWVWDRITVTLEKGDNTIRISPEGFVLIDHLNIIKN
jgi:hypothetical protein